MLKYSFSTMAAVSFVPTGREPHHGPVADTVTPLLTGVGGSYRKLRAGRGHRQVTACGLCG